MIVSVAPDTIAEVQDVDGKTPSVLLRLKEGNSVLVESCSCVGTGEGETVTVICKTAVEVLLTVAGTEDANDELLKAGGVAYGMPPVTSHEDGRDDLTLVVEVLLLVADTEVGSGGKVSSGCGVKMKERVNVLSAVAETEGWPDEMVVRESPGTGIPVTNHLKVELVELWADEIVERDSSGTGIPVTFQLFQEAVEDELVELFQWKPVEIRAEEHGDVLAEPADEATDMPVKEIIADV